MKALLDACVIIPAALRDTLLRAANAGMYTVHWSATILEEVSRNLLEMGLSAEQTQSLIFRMNVAFPEAAVSNYEHLISSMKNDTKDRHVLAAAVSSGSTVIVTSNLRHFPEDVLVLFGVQAISPDAFLTMLFTQDPGLVAHIVLQQANALKRPTMSVYEVLDILAQQAPIFAQLVRRELEPLA